MCDDRLCNMKEIGTVLIKMFDEMVRELKEVRYVPQLKKNLIYIGALETLGLEIYGRDVILKMLRDSMVVLKGIQCNSLYYLKGNMVTGQVVISIGLNDDCTRL